MTIHENSPLFTGFPSPQVTSSVHADQSGFSNETHHGITPPDCLLSELYCYVNQQALFQIKSVINAVNSVLKSEGFLRYTQPETSDFSPHLPAHKGVFNGYDFHITSNGPKLIEINTNAGGSLLNVYQLKSGTAFEKMKAKDIEDRIVDMFRREWAIAKGTTKLKTIALVDNNPSQQFLYFEFLLFKELFQKYNIHVIITDPSNLRISKDQLYYDNNRIDLVYNRLTDFYLTSDISKVIRDAYHNNACVVTPNPKIYRSLADKGNLAILGNKQLLRSWDIPTKMIDLLVKCIPTSTIVTAENQAKLWENRKGLYFKPKTGYGSKAVYWGGKITKKTWRHILNNEYVSQIFAPPGEFFYDSSRFKYDVRSFAYDGDVFQTCARVYRGQTTNFRTLGGGLAVVRSR